MCPAISLIEKRRLEAERLRTQVDKVTAEPPWPDRGRLIDKRELRGWPCAGHGICGAVSESIPGWNLFDDDG
jgi:hypothetical protein